jgi:mannose-6-phosphate isomerase-like protein (cupin superfamily)
MADLRLECWDSSDGPITEKGMMGLMESEGYEVASYAYRPSTAFSPHEHAQDKCDAVLQGVLRVVVGDETFDLGPGDRLYLPAGTRHSAQVVGATTVLSLDGTRW